MGMLMIVGIILVMMVRLAKDERTRYVYYEADAGNGDGLDVLDRPRRDEALDGPNSHQRSNAYQEHSAGEACENLNLPRTECKSVVPWPSAGLRHRRRRLIQWRWRVCSCAARLPREPSSLATSRQQFRRSSSPRSPTSLRAFRARPPDC